MDDIKENELKEFVDWYFTNFDTTETSVSVITTCMCGHFHITRNQATRALKRCYFLNLLRRAGNRVRPATPPPRDPWWEKREKREEAEQNRENGTRKD